MKNLFLLLAVAISTASMAQTKRIAHRSHSGQASTFTIAGPDNFGETPEMIENRRKQDSLAKKAVADSIAGLKPVVKQKKKKKGKG